ncbi:hypothetical protein MRX96_013491 [Rhipicephalus microplus]
MRGLESFSQLVNRYNATHFWVNESEVVDAPRFSHRGLLLNTGQHFLPVATIVEALDAMAFNKLNVLHWRIADEHSFPFVSQAFPDLSLKGAYNPESLVYQPSDIDRVLNEARDRGIRIVPELSNPGKSYLKIFMLNKFLVLVTITHTMSWGKAFPHLLANCEDENGRNVGFLNPTLNSTFVFLHHLLAEVARLFPDDYLHLSGDGLRLDCWKSDKEIATYLLKMNISGRYQKLLVHYYKRLLIIVNKFHKSPVFWEDVFKSNVHLPRHAVVQTYENSGHPNILSELTAEGHHVVVSHCWLLDVSALNGSWEQLYRCDPHDFHGTAKQKALIVGGEVGFWNDSVDRTNLISSTWCEQHLRRLAHPCCGHGSSTFGASLTRVFSETQALLAILVTWLPLSSCCSACCLEPSPIAVCPSSYCAWLEFKPASPNLDKTFFTEPSACPQLNDRYPIPSATTSPSCPYLNEHRPTAHFSGHGSSTFGASLTRVFSEMQALLAIFVTWLPLSSCCSACCLEPSPIAVCPSSYCAWLEFKPASPNLHKTFFTEPSACAQLNDRYPIPSATTSPSCPYLNERRPTAHFSGHGSSTFGASLTRVFFRNAGPACYYRDMATPFVLLFGMLPRAITDSSVPEQLLRMVGIQAGVTKS